MSEFKVNPHKLIKLLQNKREIVDYTYATLFLLISSFFILFVIRPSLITAFTLQEKRARLTQIDRDYEKDITNIINIQSQLVELREDLYYLDLALPRKPNIRNLTDLIVKMASAEGIEIKNFSISSIDLINKKEALNKFNILLEVHVDFLQGKNFIKRLKENIRLIDIERLVFSKVNQESTESGVIKLDMTLEAYYL